MKIDLKKLKSYFRNLQQKGISTAEMKQKLNSVDNFVNWANKKGLLTEDKYKQLSQGIAEIRKKINSIFYRIAPETWVNRLKRWRGGPHFVSTKRRNYVRGYKNQDTSKSVFVKPWFDISPSEFDLRHYIGISMILLVMSAMGAAAYNQFFKEASTPFAFPANLTKGGRMLSFQGRLTDSIGNPISTATNIKFKLYNGSTSGTTLYDSTACSLTPDQDGVFDVLIGGTSYSPTPPQDVCGTEIPENIFSDWPNVYLGVTVGSDTEAAPRQQIANVGYAINAETLKGFPPGTGFSNIPYINSDGNIIIATSAAGIRNTWASTNFTLSSTGTITVQSAGTGDVALTATESGNITATTGSSTALFNVLTGNLKVGNGTPGVTLGGEDAYIEGTLEVDGATTLDGALTANGNITFSSAQFLGASPLVFEGLTDNNITTTFAITDPTVSNKTITFTNETGTVCLDTGNCSDSVVGADSLDFTEFEDTLDLDANLTLNQTTYTWAQDFTGTTTTGYTYSANSLTTGTAATFSSTSTAGGASGSSKVLNIARSGANSNATHTAYGLYSAVTNTGTTSTNVGGYFSASGATNNYGLIVNAGNVGIGTTAPIDKLTINSEATAVGLGLRYHSTYPNLRGVILHGGNSAGILSAGGLQIAAQGADNSIDGSGKIVFFTTAVDSANGSTDATYVERMRILHTGEVGIGDTTPAALFTVGSGDLFQVNSSGLAFLPNGSSSAPSLSFTGDTDTGFYKYGTDEIGVTAGSTARFSIPGGATNPTIFQSRVSSTSGSQLRLGSGYAPTIGVRQSGADAFYTSNAYQTTIGSDAWDKESATYSSNLIRLGLSTGNNGIAFQVKHSPANTVTGTFANFYTADLLTVNESGKVGIGDASPASLFTVGSGDLFQVDTAGDVVKLKNVTYSWPSSQGAASTVLTNNGSGTLTWQTLGAATIDDNSLDFIKFEPTLDLDTDLILNQGAFTWVQDFTGTTTTGYTYSANALTTGTAMSLGSTSTAGGASGSSKVLNIARSGANAQLAHTAYGIYSAVTNTNATSGTNIAGYFSASGATTANYGLIVENGNVGIGTTAPGQKLEVTGGNIFITDTSGKLYLDTGSNYLTYDGSNLQAISGAGINLGATTGVTMTLGSSAGNDFNVDGGKLVVEGDTGNVGIGTTAPDDILHTITTTASRGLKIENTDPGASGANIRLYHNSASPAANDLVGLLTFNGNDSAANLNTYAQISATIGSPTDTTETGAIHFKIAQTGGALTEKMTVDTTGNVGIGITAPVSNLHTYESNANTSSNAGITVEQASTGDALVQYLLTGQQRWVTGVDNSDSDKFKISSDLDLNDNVRLTIETGGNVGIGDTSPAALFTVGSGDLFQVNSSGAIAASTGIANSGGYTQSGASANTLSGLLTANGGLTVNGTTTITSTADDATFTGFVTNDSGVLKYRTTAQAVTDLNVIPKTSGSLLTALTGSTWYRVATRSGNAGRFSARIVVSNTGGSGTPNQVTFQVTKDWSTVATINLIGQSGTSCWNAIRVVDDTNVSPTATYVDMQASGACTNSYVTVIPEETNFAGVVASNFTAPAGGTETTRTTLDITGNTFVGLSSNVAGGDNLYRLTSTGIQTTTGYIQSGVVANTFTGTSTFSNATYSALFTGGNVGIGTTAPNAKLELWHDTASQLRIHTNRELAGDSSSILFSAAGTGTANTYQKAGVFFESQAAGSGRGNLVFALNNVASSANVTTANAVMTLLPTGYVGIGDTSPAANLVVGSDATITYANGAGDVYIQNDLEVDGIIYGAVSGDLTCTDCIDFVDFEDTLDLDANLALNQTTYTWTQDYTGTTGTGYTYSANSLTTGTGVSLGSTSTAGGASGSSKVLNIARSGTNSNATHTAYGLYSAVTNTGTTSTNVGGYFSASGATNNYGLIVNAGNVGIGTTTPAYALDIGGSGVLNVGGNTIRFGGTKVAGVSGSNLQFNAKAAAANVQIVNYTSGTPLVTFNDGGNVGIGTTAPDTALEVTKSTAGSFPTLGTASGIQSITGSSGLWGLYTGTDNSSGNFWMQVMRNDAANAYALVLQPVGGNVGIGTTSPVVALDVYGSANIRDGYNLTWGGVYGVNIPTIFAVGGASSYIKFNPAGSSGTAMTLLNNGNVGIGTTAPDARLEINHATGDSLRLTYNDSDGSATNYTDFSLASTGALTLTGSAATLAASATAEKTFLTLIPGIITLTAPTAVTSLMETAVLTGATIAADAATTVNKATTLSLVAPVDSTNATITADSALRILNVTSGAGTLTNQYGILVEDMTSGATADFGIAIAGADTAALWISSDADTTDAANGIAFGLSRDTNLYRSAANVLKTDDSLTVGVTLLTTILRATGGSPGNNYIGLAVADAAAELTISPQATTTKPLVVRGKAAQTANLTEWQNSAGTELIVIDAAGNVGIGDTSPAANLVVGSDATITYANGAGDVYVQNDLEVDGIIYGAVSGDLTCTDCIDFIDFEDTLDLDANLALNQTTYTWAQDYTGTTGTGYTYSANSLTTGTGVSLGSTSTAGGASGSSTILNIARSGANAQLAHTAYGIYSAVTNTNVTSGTNIAGYFSASGATTANYGLIVANGDVGIGTTSPQAKLEVNSGNTGGSSPGTFMISGSAGGNYGVIGQLDFYNSYTSSINTQAQIKTLRGVGNYKSGQLAFFTSAPTTGTLTQHMTIDESGKVGIGTTGPTAKLTLSNNVATGFLDTYAEYQEILYDGGTAALSYGFGIKGNTMVFNSGVGAYSFDDAAGTTSLQIDTDGNVGIGTTAPGYKLDVNNGATAAYPINLVSSSKFVRIGALNSSYAHFDTDTSLGFYFYDDITTAGDIVIGGGNINPSAALTIGDNGDTLYLNSSDWDISTTGVMTGISGITNDGSYTQTGTSANTFTGTSTFSNATYSALFTGGNVGIGTTTPAYELDVSGFTNTKSLYDVSPEGLLLGMSFNTETITGSIALDSSDYNNHGTITNATLDVDSGFNGGGTLVFDGNGDYVTVSSISTAKTQEGWFYFTQLASVKVASNNLFNNLYQHQANNYLYISGTSDYFAWTPSLSTWYHIVFAYPDAADNVNAKLYVNGVQYNLTQQPAAHDIDPITTISFTGTAAFTGNIDDVSIYNRQLTQDEIKAHYLQRYEIKNSYISQKDVYVNSSGYVGIGDTSPASLFTVGSADLFQVDTAGDVVKLKNVTYSWPSSQGAASTVLTNNGSGTLTWQTLGAATIDDDSLDFIKFEDTLDLDANLILNQAAYTWTQNFTGTTTTGYTYNADSVTTGIGQLVSADALTTGTAVSLTSTSTAGGASGSSKVLNIARSGTNSNATHTAYGLYSAVTNTGTTSTNIGGYFSASGATNNYGLLVENGDVGIGTTAPIALLELEKASGNDVQLRLDQNGVRAWTIENTATSGNLAFNDGSGDLVTFEQNTGKVGIGTTGPSQKLSVGTTTSDYIQSYGGFIGHPSANIGGTGDAAYFPEGIYSAKQNWLYGGIAMNSGALTAVGSIGITGSYTQSGTSANTFTGTSTFSNATYSALFTGGNVGIGTTAPSQKLSVVGNIELDQAVGVTRYILTDEINTGTGRVTIQAGAGSAGYGGGLNLFAHSNTTKPGWVTAGLSASAGSGATEARFTVNDQGLAGGTDVFTVLRTGNVGIGDTSPAANLVVGSDATITYANGAGDVYVQNDLEVDGIIYGAVSGDLTCTDCIDFVDFEDTLDLDANLTLNQTTYTWAQDYTGTTGTGYTYSANSLTTGTGVSLGSTSTAGGASGTSKVLNIARSGVNAQLAHTAYGLYSTVTNTNVTSGTNIAGYFSASGATTANYGLIVENGNVGIGTTSPSNLLEIEKSTTDTGIPTTSATDARYRLLISNPHLTNYATYAIGFTSYGGTATAFISSDTYYNGDYESKLSFGTRDDGTDGLQERMRITNTGYVGIGDTSPAALLTVGNGDLFQVNSSGAIAAATGITSSGTVNFSGLTASRFVLTDVSKNLTSSGLSSVLLNTLTDETGTGVSVFGTSPAITTSLTTPSTTFALVNTTATTVNFAGAATTLSIGATTGYTGINNHIKSEKSIVFEDPHSTDLYRVANASMVHNDVANLAGYYIVIEGPTNATTPADMVLMRVRGYNYETTRNIFDVEIAGYSYTTFANNDGWRNKGLFPISAVNAYKVTATGRKVWVITPGVDDLDYMQLYLDVDIAGYDAAASESLNQGWDLKITNDLSAYTIENSVPEQQVYEGSTHHAWQINMTEKMRLTATGLGIGTTAPETSLDVRNAVSGDQIRLGSTSFEYIMGRNTTTGFLEFKGTQATYTGYDFLSDDGSHLVTIIDSGNVGIGTTAPGAKLDVAGTPGSSYLDLSPSSNPGSTGTYGEIRFWGDSGKTSTRYAAIRGVNTGGTNQNELAFLVNYADSGTYQNIEAMRIDNYGNVGIGDTTPAALLTVGNGDLFQVNTTGNVTVAGSGTTGITITDTDFTNALSIGDNNIIGTTANIDLTNFDVVGSSGDITTGGDIAINGGDITTSLTAFNLLNTTATTINFAGAATALNIGAATGYTAFDTSTLYIDATNNRVGVGDISPDAELDIDSTATTTNVFGILNTALTTGSIVKVNSTSIAQTSGKMLDIDHTATYTTNYGVSGNVMLLNRNLTSNTGNLGSPNSITHASTTEFGTTNCDPCTFSHTVSANSSKLLIIAVATMGTSSNPVTSVTFNGDSLTQFNSVDGVDGDASIWYTVTPDVTTGTVSIDFPDSQAEVIAGASNFYNVDQITPLDGSVTDSSTNTGDTNTVTSETNDLVYSFVGVNNIIGSAIVTNASQTEILNQAATSDKAAASYKAGAASVAMSYTWTEMEGYVHVAANINPLPPSDFLNLTGPVLSVNSTCTTGTGTCVDSSNVLKLTQNFTSATGSVLLINGLGTGNLLEIQDTNTAVFSVDDNGNVKIAGTAKRATTEGTNHLDIFNGTAPVGTLTNGTSIYATSGELRTMDSAGNATLQTPHDDNNLWVFDSTLTTTGERLLVDMEKLVKSLNKEFGWDYVHEWGTLPYDDTSELTQYSPSDSRIAKIFNNVYINNLDNIGIKTQTPNYDLEVAGDVAANSFVNVSTREAKKDISYLGTWNVERGTKKNALDLIKDLKIAQYHYKNESSSNPLRLGLIAEETPSMVLSNNGKGVDIYKLTTLAIGGIQAQQKDFEDIKAKVAELQASIVIPDPDRESIVEQILNRVEDDIRSFENAIKAFKDSIASLQNDIAGIKDSIASLQNDVATKILNTNYLSLDSKLISPVVETDTLQVNQVASVKNLVSEKIEPKEKELTIDLSKNNNIEGGQLSKLIIKGLNDNKVAEFDAAGNATISGTLTSAKIETSEASISGKLIAKEIQADNINQILNQVQDDVRSFEDDKLSIQNSKGRLDEQGNSINDIQKFLADLQNQPTANVANYQDAQTLNNLSVTGDTSLYRVFISNTLTAGNILITDNKIMSLDFELKLTALSSINLLDGQVIISKTGGLTTKGPITALAGIKTNKIEPLNPNENVFVKNLETNKLQISDKYLEATTSASIITASDNFESNGLYSPAIETKAETAGIGLIKRQDEEIIVYNDTITKDSLVYLTPTVNTSDNVLSVTEKETCGKVGKLESGNVCKPYFKVATAGQRTNDVKFNWLIIN